MRSEKILSPLKGKIKERRVVTFDIESKDGDSQARGFTRPFLVDFFDGEKHYEFRNDPSVQHLPWETRHIQKGGCIDKFMRWLLALDGCKYCGYRYTLKAATEAGRPCRACREHRQKYSASTTDIYSHNGGRFDELFIIGWFLLNRDLVRFELNSVGNRIQRLEVMPASHESDAGKNTGLRWVFLDSAALIPLALHKIGKDILGGVEKIESVQNAMNLAREKKVDHNLDLHEDDPDWTVYVRGDNEVLFLGVHVVTELLEKLGGERAITAPSASMKLFRRAFQKKPIARNRHFAYCDETCHKSEDEQGKPTHCSATCDMTCHGCAHEFIRLGYYGGRTELYRRQAKNIYYYDINSSYPASMMEDMPVGEMVELDPSLGLDVLARMRLTHIGFLECDVEIPPGVEIPPLPVRHEGKLIFPTGKLRGVWDYDELALLAHPTVNGRIVKIHKSVWYRKDPIFREMVTILYHYRTKHAKGCATGPDGLGQVCKKKSCNPDYTEGLAYVCKLMLNSLYGKFGMREERSGIIMVGRDEAKPADGWPLGGDHDSPFWEIEKYVDAAYVIPQISAHITSLSRIRLWHGMAEVVQKGGYICYVDTDSIMCSVPITTSDELGGWKREEAGRLIDGEWILPKLYQLKMHYPNCIDDDCEGCIREKDLHLPTCKDKECIGCTGSIQKMKGVQYVNQTPENWKSMVYERETVEGLRLTQVKTMLNASMLSPVMVPARKSLQTEYDKRVLNKDGMGSTALHITKTVTS
jgi:hypothetical protein